MATATRLDLDPNRKPERLVLRTKTGEDLLLWPPAPFQASSGYESVATAGERVPTSPQDWRRATRVVDHRAAAHVALAREHIAAGEFSRAEERLEEALLFNGDDPLAWWLKGAIRRHLGSLEEGPELPNAHYLAPMEPVLRAEALFTQPEGESSEPNALILPLADHPDLLAECALRLLEAGLFGLAFTGPLVPVRKFAGADSVIAWTTLSPRVGVAVPVRVNVYEDTDGKTYVNYVKPSDQLAPFKNDEITNTSKMLDEKLGMLTGMLSK